MSICMVMVSVSEVRAEYKSDPEASIPWVSAPFAIKTDAVRARQLVYTGAGTGATGTQVGNGTFVITEVSAGPGSMYGWGKLGDGRGWINLDCTSYGPLTVTVSEGIRANQLIYLGAGTNTGSKGTRIGTGAFMIAEVRQAPGSICGWGRLGNGRGWINLDFTSYTPYDASASSIPWVSVPFSVEIDSGVRANQLIYIGAGTNTSSTDARVGKGVFKIAEVKPGTGSMYGWGKLGDGRGWINLDCTSFTPFTVKIDSDAGANQFIYAGAGTNTSSTGIRIGKGTFRIAEFKSGYGSKNGWAKLGDERGWISLDYATIVK